MRYLPLLLLAGCATFANPFWAGYELSFDEAALPPNARVLYLEGNPVVIIEEDSAAYALMPHRNNGLPAVSFAAVNKGGDYLDVNPGAIELYLGKDVSEPNALRRLTQQQYQRAIGSRYTGQRIGAALAAMGGVVGAQSSLERVYEKERAAQTASAINSNQAADMAAAGEGYLLRTSVPPGGTYEGTVFFQKRDRQGRPRLFLVFTTAERVYTLPVQYYEVGK